MKKEKILSALVVVIFASVLFQLFYSFAEEKVVFTTYYPAPYGYYKEIRTARMSVGAAYRNALIGDGELLVSGRVGIGTTNPTARIDIDEGIPGYAGLRTPFLKPGNITTDYETLYFGNQTDHWGGIGRSRTTQEGLILFSEGDRNIVLLSPYVGLPYDSTEKVYVPSNVSFGRPSANPGTEASPLVIYSSTSEPDSGEGFLKLSSSGPKLVIGESASGYLWITPVDSSTDLNLTGNTVSINYPKHGKVGIRAVPVGNAELQLLGNVSFDYGGGSAYPYAVCVEYQAQSGADHLTPCSNAAYYKPVTCGSGACSTSYVNFIGGGYAGRGVCLETGHMICTMRHKETM